MIKLLENSSILPFNPEHFLRVFPNDKVKSKRGAEDLVKNLNTTLPLIRILISNYVLFEYKHSESRKRARALISSDITNPQETLENMLEVRVSEVKAI